MKQQNQPLISQYQRERREIPRDERERILNSLRNSVNVTTDRIAKVLNVQPQTVRCWFSEKNSRMITTHLLVELCEFYGKNAYKDF